MREIKEAVAELLYGETCKIAVVKTVTVCMSAASFVPKYSNSSFLLEKKLLS